MIHKKFSAIVACFKSLYDNFRKNRKYSNMMGRRGRDRMVFVFTTTCAISAYHQLSCESNSVHGEVYSIQLFV